MRQNKFISTIIGSIISGLIVASSIGAYRIFISKAYLEKEITYSVIGPLKAIDTTEIREIKINEKLRTNLFAYQIKIWNSGFSPLNDVPMKIVFDNYDDDFSILFFFLETKPEIEFGNIFIAPEEDSNYSKRFIFSLLNKKDEATLTMFTSNPARLSVGIKAEGVIIKQYREYNKKIKYLIIILKYLLCSTFAIACYVSFLLINAKINKKNLFDPKPLKSVQDDFKNVDLEALSSAKELTKEFQKLILEKKIKK